MEIEESLRPQEIEEALSHLRYALNAIVSIFGLGVKSRCAYFHCKS